VTLLDHPAVGTMLRVCHTACLYVRPTVREMLLIVSRM
jgi:hypothetical protein